DDGSRGRGSGRNQKVEGAVTREDSASSPRETSDFTAAAVLPMRSAVSSTVKPSRYRRRTAAACSGAIRSRASRRRAARSSRATRLGDLEPRYGDEPSIERRAAAVLERRDLPRRLDQRLLQDVVGRDV